MQPAYIIADHIITPLGETTEDIFNRMCAGETSVLPHSSSFMGTYYASSFSNSEVTEGAAHTRIEQLCIKAIRKACSSVNINPSSADIVYLFSTTKGNIELLADDTADQQRLLLHSMASAVTHTLGNKNKPLIVSNACISGVQAIQFAHVLLNETNYRYAVVCGCDVYSAFIESGFHSFQALSPFPCTPFDKHRAGLSLGEGCGVMILSLEQHIGTVKVEAARSSNDANHISGPSRTGDGLSIAIQHVLRTAGLKPEQIDLINAHGTGTIYNDEMEALAFTACGLQHTPVNSLKGYIGHTLGASGVIEVILTAHSLKMNILLPSAGYTESGTSVPLKILKQVTKGKYSIALKTASGFGGGNIAMILKK